MAARLRAPEIRDLSSFPSPSYTIRFPAAGAGVPPRILGIKSARDRIRRGAGFLLGLRGIDGDGRSGWVPSPLRNLDQGTEQRARDRGQAEE